MAPIKRPRNSSMRNRDKTRRRKRTNDTDMLYQCIGKLCGEECDEDIHPLSESSRSSYRREDARINSNKNLNDEKRDNVRNARGTAQKKNGRVNKVRPRKTVSAQSNEINLQEGMRKAKMFLCEALNFGVQSTYLIPKDAKGQVLRVSSDLLQMANSAKPGVLQRIKSDANTERKMTPKRPRGNSQDEMLEMRDDDGDGVEMRGHRSKRRSRSRRSGRRRGGKSRSKSRSRSTRRRGRRHTGRSRSANAEVDVRAKQNTEDIEQDEMAENNNDTNGSNNRKEDNNDDNKSVKSIKSAKSTQTVNSDSQNTVEEKKQDDDDGTNEEGSEDEDNNKE